MGPNTATGHSSVLFTSYVTFSAVVTFSADSKRDRSECQITMILKVLGPVLKTLTHLAPSKNPAPYVEVTLEAEKEYYASMRAAMKERVWEKNGGVVSSTYFPPGRSLISLLCSLGMWRHPAVSAQLSVSALPFLHFTAHRI